MQYRVILAWGQPDEGNYCDVFEAPDEEAAKRMCAERMFDEEPWAREDYTPEEREQWILTRMAACDDICIERELDVHVRALIAAARQVRKQYGNCGCIAQQEAAKEMDAAIVAAQRALSE